MQRHPIIARPCRQCGMSFTPKQKSGPGTYCSYRCRGAAQTADAIARFWKTVSRRGEQECWPWLGHTFSAGGHGLTCYQNRSLTTQRLAWILTHGPVPLGLHVLHTCDNPPCCNPAHLYLGTHQRNMQDMDERGRRPKGEAHKNAILTDDIVREIRRRYADGESQKSLRAAFGIRSTGLICDIVHRRRWKHVN